MDTEVVGLRSHGSLSPPYGWAKLAQWLAGPPPSDTLPVDTEVVGLPHGSLSPPYGCGLCLKT